MSSFHIHCWLYYYFIIRLTYSESLSVLPSYDHTPRRTNHFPGLFIFGYGNVGSAICRNILFPTTDLSAPSTSYPAFTHIYASARSINNIPLESPTGITFVSITDTAQLESCLSTSSHILITIPPMMNENIPLNTNLTHNSYKDAILDSDISNMIPSSSWIGFLSTTGVYGNHDNEWVDESNTTIQGGVGGGTVTKAHAFLDVEQRWKKKAMSIHATLRIFRCAGIYGNHASALHTILKTGFHEDPKSQVLTSRIHIQDVARAILTSMNQYNRDTHRDIDMLSSQLGSEENYDIYNLSDDEPASRYDVFTYASTLLLSQGWVLPTRNATTITVTTNTTLVKTSERQKRRLQESKRVMNKKMKDQLLGNQGLTYKTYREGLLSILQYIRHQSIS